MLLIVLGAHSVLESQLCTDGFEGPGGQSQSPCAFLESRVLVTGLTAVTTSTMLPLPAVKTGDPQIPRGAERSDNEPLNLGVQPLPALNSPHVSRGYV